VETKPHSQPMDGPWVGSRFIVMPRSDFSLVARKGDTKHNRNRRSKIFGASPIVPGCASLSLSNAQRSLPRSSSASMSVAKSGCGRRGWWAEPVMPSRDHFKCRIVECR
jgi:hypothetical protein